MKLIAAAILTFAFIFCVTDEQLHHKSGKHIAFLTATYAVMIGVVIV